MKILILKKNSFKNLKNLKTNQLDSRIKLTI